MDKGDVGWPQRFVNALILKCGGFLLHIDTNEASEKITLI